MCPTLCDPWTVAYQAPQCMEFSSQEYWSGLPFPSPGALPDPGIKPGSPHCRQVLYHLSHQGSPVKWGSGKLAACSLNLISPCPLPREVWYFQLSSVQSLSRVWLFATPWTTACQASLSITNSQSLLKLMSTESVMPSNHLILCRPLLLPPSVFPSIRVFSNESLLHIRWPKHWSFSFSISPSSECSGLTEYLGLTLGSPWSPRDSQESSPTPQSKSINTWKLSFLYDPTLTSIRDYCKNHSFD